MTSSVCTKTQSSTVVNWLAKSMVTYAKSSFNFKEMLELNKLLFKNWMLWANKLWNSTNLIWALPNKNLFQSLIKQNKSSDLTLASLKRRWKIKTQEHKQELSIVSNHQIWVVDSPKTYTVCLIEPYFYFPLIYHKIERFGKKYQIWTFLLFFIWWGGVFCRWSSMKKFLLSVFNALFWNYFLYTNLYNHTELDFFWATTLSVILSYF